MLLPTTSHKEREQLGDQRNIGESNFNSGDGTGQMAQPWMFMMIMKDDTYGYSGTQYGLFRKWASELFMAMGHFVIVV
jgi:hypothetical protein